MPRFNTDFRRVSAWSKRWSLVAGLVMAACAEDKDGDPSGAQSADAGDKAPRDSGSAVVDAGEESPRDASSADGRDAGKPAGKALYALARVGQTPDGMPASYVTLSRDLDIELDETKEHELYGDVSSYNGSLFANTGDKVVRYDITDDLTLKEAGTVNFTNYPLPEGANAYFMTQVAKDRVYLQYEVYKRVVWDPAGMKIIESKDDSSLPREVDALPLHEGGNGNGIRFADSKSWLLYNYMDVDWYDFGSKSYAVSFDASTHEEKQAVEIACPGISTISQDEDGYRYLSAGSYTGLQYRYGQGPKPCIVRLEPSGEIDESWTTDLSDILDGRYGTLFEYVRDGFAITNVLFHEELGANFDDETIPAAVQEELWEQSHWQGWVIDLEKKTGHQLIESRGRLSPGSVRKLGGRSFVRVRNSTTEETSEVVEITAKGDVERVENLDGFDGSWFQLR